MSLGVKMRDWGVCIFTLKSERKNMTEITRKITVDLARRGNSRLIFARQNDFNSRRIVINLTNAGVPFPVEKNNVVLINFARSDGESAAFYGDVENDGSVSIILGSWQLATVGEVKCSVSIFSGEDQKLTSADFFLDVEAALYAEDKIITDESYPILVGLIAEISEIKSIEQSRVEAENRRNEAEVRRAETERSRATAELARARAEEERNNLIGDIDVAIDNIIVIQQQIIDGTFEVGGNV